MLDDCIFCKIINKELPSYTIYEDNDFIAILDLFPGALGHTILIPKQHAENLFELPNEIAAKCLVTAKKLALAIKTALGCSGINVLQNNGVDAGQSVNHLHIHLIPRTANDDFKIPWKTLKPNEEEFSNLRNKICGAL